MYEKGREGRNVKHEREEGEGEEGEEEGENVASDTREEREKDKKKLASIMLVAQLTRTVLRAAKHGLSTSRFSRERKKGERERERDKGSERAKQPLFAICLYEIGREGALSPKVAFS